MCSTQDGGSSVLKSLFLWLVVCAYQVGWSLLFKSIRVTVQKNPTRIKFVWFGRFGVQKTEMKPTEQAVTSLM